MVKPVSVTDFFLSLAMFGHFGIHRAACLWSLGHFLEAGSSGSRHWSGGGNSPWQCAVLGWDPALTLSEGTCPLLPAPPWSASGARLEPSNPCVSWQEYSCLLSSTTKWYFDSLWEIGQADGRWQEPSCWQKAITVKPFSWLVPVRHRINLKTRQSLEEGRMHGS